MVVYQKFGVIGTTLVFAVLQKLKFQLFRLFIVYDTCRRTNTCDNSTDLLNTTDIYFQDENVSDYIFKCLIVNNTVSIFPCIFLAAWSDKHGRKVLLSLPFVGSIIGDILMLVLLYVPIASKNMLLLSEAVHGFCGGTVLIGLGCLCYLTDSTDHRLRTWFIGLLLGMINFLPVIEMAFQYFFNPIKISLDFRTLILIGISIRMFLTVYFLIYIKIFVVESVFVLGSYQGNPWANLLTPINVSDTVNCVFKRRLDNMRFFIIALCTVFIFYSFVLYGNITVWTQHFWKFFHMSLKNVMIFSGTYASCQTLILWISIYSALKCRVLDIELGIYGTVSLAASCITLTFIRNCWLAVMGALISIASLLIPTSILSVLSKLIERNETGSMYAGIGFLMLVSQLMSIPSYRALYEICTEAGIPQVTFLLSFGFATFGMLFFIYLKKLIAPDLLGHLNASESLALISRKTEFEQLFQ
ncbi:uncharacterized protein LOC129960743 [Argiope bruennichi]|uniref:uncharacterized protein LOC129960743 n=1 Tax=Argiope bruennichi TaxID=94029 RepID=UPI00249488F1|nr:uncharacterized protein LOC129960743 [Argiope bruennichi]XP_055930331.1 uncharacterized protein LOC129960743 [Argiope bruennichi]XP_055930332.1 uncharacterized protein LOC129960743 [Argiope bruennichi]